MNNYIVSLQYNFEKKKLYHPDISISDRDADPKISLQPSNMIARRLFQLPKQVQISGQQSFPLVSKDVNTQRDSLSELLLPELSAIHCCSSWSLYSWAELYTQPKTLFNFIKTANYQPSCQLLLIFFRNF